MRGPASAAPSGWTSSITAPALRISPRKIPPICVSSNARCTSATNAPSVTTSRTSPKITVSVGANARPARSLCAAIAAIANSAYVAVAVGRARPAITTGSRRRRAASLGE